MRKLLLMSNFETLDELCSHAAADADADADGLPMYRAAIRNSLLMSDHFAAANFDELKAA